MQYLGGKYRIAKHIESLVLEHRGKRASYIEPFIGGGATMAKNAPHFKTALGADISLDLILLWRMLQAGWIPPDEMSEDEYQSLRDTEPSALRSFAGFGCSFGGKWFGGYTRGHPGRIMGDGLPYSHIRASARSCLRDIGRMGNVEFILSDYRNLNITEQDAVYCDPPYSATTAYAVGGFDSADFWRTAESWAASGAMVLVSELTAPEGWRSVWSRPGPAYLRGDQERDARVEQVFVFKP